MTAATYKTPVKQFPVDRSPCCGGNADAIGYNAYNSVVQCGNCGHVWEPKAIKTLSGEEMRDGNRH